MDDYNYASFPLDMDDEVFAAFPGLMKAGDPAPDGDLVDLDTGETVRLSSLWRSEVLVIEFGSVT